MSFKSSFINLLGIKDFQTSRHCEERSNPLHNQVNELAGDCFTKLRKARNDEHSFLNRTKI